MCLYSPVLKLLLLLLLITNLLTSFGPVPKGMWRWAGVSPAVQGGQEQEEQCVPAGASCGRWRCPGAGSGQVQGRGAAVALPSCGFGDTRHRKVPAVFSIRTLPPPSPPEKVWPGGKSACWRAPAPIPASLLPQMMTAPTASPPTRWPACIATWTWCTSAGDTARSQRPSRSPPWSPGRHRTRSASTGCLPSAGSSTRGEGGPEPARRDKGPLGIPNPHRAGVQAAATAPGRWALLRPSRSRGAGSRKPKEHQEAKPALKPQSAIRG